MAYCAVHPRSLNIFLNSYFFSQSQTLSPLPVTRAAWHVVCLKSKICLPLIHFCSASILPPSALPLSKSEQSRGKLDTVLDPGPVPITSRVSSGNMSGKLYLETRGIISTVQYSTVQYSIDTFVVCNTG